MNRTHFDNVVDIKPAGIALKHQPTNLVFVSRKYAVTARKGKT